MVGARGSDSRRRRGAGQPQGQGQSGRHGGFMWRKVWHGVRSVRCTGLWLHDGGCCGAEVHEERCDMGDMPYSASVG